MQPKFLLINLDTEWLIGLLHLNSHHPRMLCVKFWLKYWRSGSGEEDEIVYKQTDDRRSETFTWAFSSGELKLFTGHLMSVENTVVRVHKTDDPWVTLHTWAAVPSIEDIFKFNNFFCYRTYLEECGFSNQNKVIFAFPPILLHFLCQI